MLEVVNLTKIYQTKGGARVKALDNVTVRFPDRGMVFLLGKSGSGKSTLLNLCGGLDSPSSGEIIVKGRSSRNFSQSDFDSYRNTFVGFIFQEYNILNEFTVEDNIALALELQGKPKDRAAIAALLEQVDLTGYAKRKPNTLSGGQKQRIAIARALVKSPEIIMADEPTGALDSATGKQVFDTLKKLSQDKLVLVVSHDREFAEQYGDRVIELKDGRIISDVSKTLEKQEQLSDNLTVVGDTLCLKKGAELTEGDFVQIRSFLKKADSDVIIATGEKDVDSFKKVNRMTNDGEKEVFRQTESQSLPKKSYNPQESAFIRSKLPLRHAVKIGTSSLKYKPVRLTFTILLCTVAFILFGILSTMMFYDSEATLTQTLKDSAFDTMRINKMVRYHETSYHNGEVDYEYDSAREGLFSAAEIAAMTAQYGDGVFGAVSAYSSFQTQTNSSYWLSSVNAMALLPAQHPLRNEITHGSYPVTADEICISSYMAQSLINRKIVDLETGSALEMSDIGDLIGKTVSLNGYRYRVSGIFHCDNPDAKYDVLKENVSNEDYMLQYTLQRELNDGFHLVVFLSEEGLNHYVAQQSVYNDNDDRFYSRRLQIDSYDWESGEYRFDTENVYENANYLGITASEQIAHYFDGNKSSLGDGEVVVSVNLFLNRFENALRHSMDELSSDPNTSEALLQEMNDLHDIFLLLYNNRTEDDEFLTDEERETYFNRVFSAINELGLDLKVQFKLYNQMGQSTVGDAMTASIVGVYGLHGDSSRNYTRLLLPDAQADSMWNTQKTFIEYYSEQTTAYRPDPDAIFGTVFVPYDHSDESTKALAAIYRNTEFDANDSMYMLSCSVTDSFYTVDSFVEAASQIFLYVGLVIAVFAVLLLSNFISTSILQKKREIGILRAVGARSIDVFKIFFSESFCITMICTLLSILGSIVVCNVLNTELAAAIGASIFVFGFISFLILVGIAILTAVVATFLPVWKAAKKKPVDSIRAL